MITMPPRHGKSQLASINFPAWYLGKNPENEIITSSYASDLALDFGSKTRRLVDDEMYQSIFSTKLMADEKSKAKWLTDKKGSYTSVGVGGAITGKGGNILLIDDPFKNREEAESDVIRQKVWDWYTSTLYTRLEPNGAIILILTRWHTDDLAGRLIDAMEKGGEKWEIVSFPAIAEEDEVHRKSGEALWSDRYSLDDLERIKKTVGVYDWEALYQQRPISSETQDFKEEWFKYFTDEDIKTKALEVFVTVDLAISEKEKADNVSIQVVGKVPTEPAWYKLEENTGRLDPLQVIEYLFHLKNKYQHKLVRVGIESVAYQKALMYFIQEEQRKRQVYFDIVELKAKTAKETRIRGLISLFKAGIMYHRDTDNEYEHELLTFPVGKHDDRIDAMAYMTQVMENTRGASNKQYRPSWAR